MTTPEKLFCLKQLSELYVVNLENFCCSDCIYDYLKQQLTLRNIVHNLVKTNDLHILCLAPSNFYNSEKCVSCGKLLSIESAPENCRICKHINQNILLYSSTKELVLEGNFDFTLTLGSFPGLTGLAEE